MGKFPKIPEFKLCSPVTFGGQEPTIYRSMEATSATNQIPNYSPLAGRDFSLKFNEIEKAPNSLL